MPPALNEYVSARLAAIQVAHNFNPSGSLKAIPQHLSRVYGQFQELLRIADAFELDVKVPYDPSGLTPIANAARRAKRPVAIYFARQLEASIWKIGSSINPIQRVKAVQTGCHVPLSLVHVLWGDGRLREKLVKRHLQPFKTRDRHNPQSGEWFQLNPALVHDIVQSLRAGTFPPTPKGDAR
jgi:hypothetical protein